MSNSIVFLVPSALTIGVLESQVLDFAIHIARNNEQEIKVVLYGNEIQVDQSKFPQNLELHFLNKTISVSEIKESKVYLRTVDAFLKYYLRLKIQKNWILYDFRALLFVESFYRRKNYLVASLIFISEFFAYCLSDQICCVSRNLEAYLLRIFFFERRIYVFPCLVAIGRRKTLVSRTPDRRDFKFVYVGSISRWQNFEKAVDLFKGYSRNESCDLTVITKDTAEALRILTRKGVAGKVLCLSHGEVLNELRYSDFGFLLRNKDLLNHVASPIKFLEYLACGVIPIMNSGIGDYSQEAVFNNIAVVLGENEKLAAGRLSKLINDPSYVKRVKDYYERRYNYSDNISKHPLVVSV
jgi:glycosyltransferase involved in cell wall biosynthesis